jgi:hypothetical protein
MYKRILLAYDGSESGQKALLDCQDIAQWSQAKLFLIAVMPLAPTYIAEGTFVDSGQEEQAQRQYQGILDEGLRRLSESGYTASGEVVVGESVNEITKYAQDRSGSDRRRPQASGGMGGPVVAWLHIARVDRACALQRARCHHALKQSSERRRRRQRRS